MKPKIRIQLLDEELRTTSDRLVDAYTEFLNGPTELHQGPVRFELTLPDEETIEKFKQYLDKLKGKLPLEKRDPKPKVAKEDQAVNEFRELYGKCKELPNVEAIIDYLNEVNFRFVSDQHIQDYGFEFQKPDEVKEFQMMTKVLRYAKDPANDRFDFSMMIYIKFIGKQSEEIFFYQNGKKKASLHKPWATSKANMKEKKIPMVFPEYMDIEERKEWRAIRRKIENGNSIIPEKKMKFYQRHAKEIQNMNAHESITLL